MFVIFIREGGEIFDLKVMVVSSRVFSV